MLQYFDFSKQPPPPSWILTMGMAKRFKLCHHAKFSGDQSSTVSDKGDYSIFQDVGRRHLGI